LEKKATGCHNPVVGIFCDKTALVAKSLAFVDNLKGSLSFGIFRTGAVVKPFLAPQKHFVALYPNSRYYLFWLDQRVVLISWQSSQ